MIIVRNYGLMPPDNWGDDCQEQLFLMNKFWNRLVEIDHADREKYQAIVGEDAEVSRLESRLAEITEQTIALSKQAKQLRAAKRSKKVDDSLIAEQIKTFREETRALKAQLKTCRAASREKHKPLLDAQNEAHKLHIKQARNESGLWWGNYNAVAEAYQVARAKAMKIGAALRFRRFDGSGRFVNQIQGGVDAADFLAGRHTVAWIDPEPKPIAGRGGKARPRLVVTIYTGHDADGRHFRRTLSFPIILHRPLPTDEGGLPVRIKTLQVNRKRVSQGDFAWSVTITATCEAETPRHAGTRAAGVNLGWKMEGQSLRVATLYDSDGDSRHYRLPAAWMAGLDRAEALRGDIDETTNAMFAALLASGVESELLKKAKRPHFGLIARLARELEIRSLRQAHLISKSRVLESIAKLPAPEALACYLAWAGLAERQFARIKAHLLGQRKDLYRTIAHDIGSKYAVVALDNADYAKMARLESVAGQENELVAKARANRFRAAPSELRLFIEQAAAKHGGTVERVGQHNECFACGRPDKQDSIMWQCGHCGAIYDQDVNMAKLLIRGYLPDGFERSVDNANAA